MIRPIDIRLNAAHPELPLAEAVTFTGSPSTVLVRGVPPNCGRWAITAVFVAATYPDGSTTTRAAVQSANGVWVATLPATATSGRTENGLRVMADGIDENGEAVTGYILGVADFAVASLGVAPAPAPGETSWQMLYFDEVPSTLRKGDVAKIDGVLKLYNGSAWEAFAAPVTLDNAVTPTSPNGVKSSGIWSAIWGALSALPAGFTSFYDWCVNQLAGKASTADATLMPRYADEWIVNPVYPEEGYTSYTGPTWSDVERGWIIYYHGDSGEPELASLVRKPSNALSLSFQDGTTATRQSTEHTLIGYALGSQTDRPLASEVEAEALRTGKANRAANPTAGNLAALDASGNPTDSRVKPSDKLDSTSAALAFTAKTYAANDLCTYNSVIYRCKVGYTATASSATPDADTTHWKAKKVSELFLPLTGGEMTGSLFVKASNTVKAGFEIVNGDVCLVEHHSGGGRATSVMALLDDVYSIGTKANRASKPTAGNLAALDAQGNPTNSLIPAANVAVKGDIPYDLVTKTISNGAVTLDDRASNSVTISATLSPNTLTINFPTAPTGKLRDFSMRLNIAAGVTAPEIAWPQGVTLENNGGEVPEIADGGTGGSSTILYFSETENNGTTAKFLVKGETLTAITQA